MRVRWKFTVGDSPIDAKTGMPLWAEPGFADSNWETVDLTPKTMAIDLTSGWSGYVSGWTAKGHRGYWGCAWYRIPVREQEFPGEEPEKLMMPTSSSRMEDGLAHLVDSVAESPP